MIEEFKMLSALSDLAQIAKENVMDESTISHVSSCLALVQKEMDDKDQEYAMLQEKLCGTREILSQRDAEIVALEAQIFDYKVGCAEETNYIKQKIDYLKEAAAERHLETMGKLQKIHEYLFKTNFIERKVDKIVNIAEQTLVPAANATLKEAASINSKDAVTVGAAAAVIEVTFSTGNKITFDPKLHPLDVLTCNEIFDVSNGMLVCKLYDGEVTVDICETELHKQAIQEYANKSWRDRRAVLESWAEANSYDVSTVPDPQLCADLDLWRLCRYFQDHVRGSWDADTTDYEVPEQRSTRTLCSSCYVLVPLYLFRN